MVKGFHNLHQQNVIQLDLKSQNILMLKYGTIKIDEFALEKIV
jgi:serine/threonine protein kinase